MISRLQRVIRDPRRVRKALGRAVAPLVGHSDYTPFVVLSRSRTGSNLLASFLNSHPHAHVEGEIFGRLNGQDQRAILDRVWGRQARYIRAKGFKLFYYHPLDGDPEHLWNMIRSVDGVRVIHLRRRNLLRTLASRRIAEQQGVWVRSRQGENPPTNAVHFEPEELERGFCQTREWEQMAELRLRILPSANLDYEDLAGDPTQEFRRVTDFLGLDPAHPRTFFRRQNPQRLSELIDNFDELRHSFRGTEWEGFFDGE